MQFTNSQAIYLQIAGFIEDKILRKEWLPDERIPSVRDLGVAMEVNPNTVVRSYDLLQQQGVIYNKRGMGYFVSENAIEMVLKDRRNQFIENEIPLFFKDVSLLNFSWDEITELYQIHIQKTTKS